MSRLAVLSLLLAFFGAPIASGDTIVDPLVGTIRLPPPSTTGAGFVVAIDIAHQEIAGTVPVRIDVTSNTRFTRDRSLTFRFEPTPGGRSPPRNSIVTEVPVLAGQGSKTVSVIRYLPKWAAGSSYRVSVIEDGQPLPNYESAIGSSIWIGRDPDLTMLNREFDTDWLYVIEEPVSAKRSRTDGLDVLAATANQVRQNRFGGRYPVRLTTIGQLQVPTDWRAYQRHDVVFVNDESLDLLSKNEEARKALRGWVLTGGTVIGFDSASPKNFCDALGVSWTDDAWGRDYVTDFTSQMLRDKATARTNRQARKKELEDQIAANRGDQYTQEELDMINLSIDADANLRRQFRWPNYSVRDWAGQIWAQRVGAGTLIGVRAEDGLIPEMHWEIVSPLLVGNQSPTIRRGVDPLVGDIRFSRWMIPGVAEPPVYTFIGLLTLFVILVGPVAYRRTTKTGRGYLMFAIAPVLAMITTLAMFGYGIVSDGFGTVARIRQMTWIDGASGDAGERIRSTYFAGISPGEGMRFPASAEVVRYPNNMGKSWNELHQGSDVPIGKVILDGETQQFDSAFLPSRQQTQFISHQPRFKVGTIELIVDDNGQHRIRSSLDFPMRTVVTHADDGRYWVVANLPAGQTRPASLVPANKISALLGKMYNDDRLEGATRQPGRSNPTEIRDLVSRISRLLTNSSQGMKEGPFEFWLNDHLLIRGGIPTGHFVGIADVREDVIAVKDTELMESIHYVFGTMP